MDNFNLIVGKSNCTPNVVQVNNFSIAIGSKILFSDSELVLAQGCVYGLIGKNGCGKTTLLNMIKNKEFPIDKRMLVLYVEQEIEETDKNPVELLMESNGEFYKINKRFMELEMIMEEDDFMEREDSDDIMDEYTQIEQEMKGFVPEAEEAKIKKILIGLGFTQELMTQPSNLFSGGWKMRISLAKALYIKPDLLLLDEPTNHLDLEAIIWLSNYIETEYHGDKKRMALVVSHNIGFLNQVCTNILNIENGKLVTYRGNYSSYKFNFNKKVVTHEKEWNKLMKKKKGKTKKEFDEIVKKSGLEEPPKPYVIKVDFASVPHVKGNLLSVQDLSFSYGSRQIFDMVDFGIDIDSRITLVGKNGVGKSTLLKLIMGEIEPSNGYVTRHNNLRVAYYHQHFENFLPKDKTPVEYLESQVPEDLVQGSKMQTVRKYLGTLKLEAQTHNSLIGNLSGGQKARVALIDIIFQKPHLILMDEPTNHLDIETVEGLIEGLQSFEGGLMVITHEPELITNLESQLWILRNNKIEFYNNTFEDYCQSIIDETDF